MRRLVDQIAWLLGPRLGAAHAGLPLVRLCCEPLGPRTSPIGSAPDVRRWMSEPTGAGPAKQVAGLPPTRRQRPGSTASSRGPVRSSRWRLRQPRRIAPRVTIGTGGHVPEPRTPHGAQRICPGTRYLAWVATGVAQGVACLPLERALAR